MPLHLIKLCVGAESIADLEEWVAERVAERVRRGGAPRSQHVTRMVPTRAPELVDGGSLYWVIKGQLAARQRLLEIEPFVGDDGIRRCRLWLDPDVAAIRPRPMRPFQGWRYFADEDAPADLTAAGQARPTCQRNCGARSGSSGCSEARTHYRRRSNEAVQLGHHMKEAAQMRAIREAAQERGRLIRDADDLVCCLAIEFEIELGLGSAVAPVCEAFELGPPQGPPRQRGASGGDAHTRRLRFRVSLQSVRWK